MDVIVALAAIAIIVFAALGFWMAHRNRRFDREVGDYIERRAKEIAERARQREDGQDS